MAVSAVVVGVSAFVIDEHAVAVKPPAVTGSVTLQAVRNADPQASRFLDDVGRSEPGWLSMPGTFVEGTVRWHLPHRLDPDSPGGRPAAAGGPDASRRAGDGHDRHRGDG